MKFKLFFEKKMIFAVPELHISGNGVHLGTVRSQKSSESD